MAEANLPLAAKVHASLARALDWVWPLGAAWAYADAIARAPRDPELRFLRGTALGRAGRWPDAARSLAAAARLRPTSAEYQGALVIALGRAGRERELVEALRRFAGLRPGEAEVHVLLGTVLRRCGRLGEALRAFRLAVRLDSLPASRRFTLGETLLGAEGWREALAAWGEARQIEAESGSGILAVAGRRSALNFHPGQPLDRVPRKPTPLQRPGALDWLRERRAGLMRAARQILRGQPWRPRGAARVRALRAAWRKAHPGLAPRKPPAAPARAPVPVAAPARAGRGRVRALAPALAVGLAASLAAGAERETPAAREQARLCERKNLEEGAAACRAALALGIGADRRGPIREILGRHLVALERWDELAELLREGVRLDSTNAAAWHRLGLTLLFALGDAAEATGALEEAARLAPRDAPFRVGLALGLQATGRATEAAAAFEEALRIDPAVLDARPAARAAMEAARRGEPWP